MQDADSKPGRDSAPPDGVSPDSAPPDSAPPDSASLEGAPPDSASLESAPPDSASSEATPPEVASPEAGPRGLPLWRTLIRHVLLASFCALVLGVADGIYTTRAAKLPMWRGALLGAGLLALVGALFGLLQGAVITAGARLAKRLGFIAKEPQTTEEKEAAKARRVKIHARILALVAAGLLAVGGFGVFLRMTERIKEAALRHDVLVLSVGGAIAGVTIVVLLLESPLSRVFAWIDGRWGLPRPKSPLVRYTLFVAVPVIAVIVPLFTTYGIKLGVLATPLGLLVFFTFEGLVWLGRCALPEALFRKGGVVLTGALAMLLVGMGSSATVMYGTWATASKVAGDGIVMPTAAESLQMITDVDRDGISSLYGGNDCAPFDSTRYPFAREIPQNGIDEDCDGADAEATEGLPELTMFSGKVNAKQRRRYNVLWLVIDSLRADHVGAYGYAKKPSPHIDELAKEGWVFERAYSQSSTTALSMPSMLTGRRPASLRWQGGYPKLAKGERMIPTVMGEGGYDTAIAVNRYVRKHLRSLQTPFQHVSTVPKGVDWKSGEYIISGVISSMERARRARKPFFITAHFDDVHHPYRAHHGRAVRDYKNANKDIAAYDRCIANLDHTLRIVTSHLKQTGAWDNTILIVTSDHGEEFKEHGKTIHSQTCYVESVHVPLIIRVPGFKPQRIKTRVSLTDIVPTLLELIPVEPKGLPVDGQSLLVPVLSPKQAPADRPIFCSIFQLLKGRKNFFTRSVRTDDHVLIHEALGDQAELYDFARDPKEKVNVAKKDPETVQRLRGLLKASATGNLWEARRFK